MFKDIIKKLEKAIHMSLFELYSGKLGNCLFINNP